MDPGGFKGFFHRHGWQNAGQTPGQHGFAAARHTDQKQIMPACSCNFQCTARSLLSAHVLQVVPAFMGMQKFAVGNLLLGKQRHFAAQVRNRLHKMIRRVHKHAFHRCHFSRISPGQNHLFHALFPGGNDHGQGTAYRHKRSVQRQFAHQQGLMKIRHRRLTAGRNDADRNG